jgi:MoaA/NifB/PqqE/SkfB family radical SAM enzyme
VETKRKLELLRLGAAQAFSETLQPLSRRSGLPLNPPSMIFMEITNECFMRCRMCDIWKNKERPDALTTAAKLGLLGQLHEWLGQYRIAFSGGEPLMKWQELVTLSRFSADRSCYSTTNTAGLTLTDTIVDALCDSGLNELHVSIDSMRAELHDELRGREGTHARALAAVRSIARRGGMRVGVQTIIHRHNIGEIVRMVGWAKELGVGIGFQPLEGRSSFGGLESFDPRWHDAHDMWPRDTAEVDAAIDALIAMRRAGAAIQNSEATLADYKLYFRDPNAIGRRRACYSGVKNLVITAHGDLGLCFVLPPVANVRGTTLRSFWASAEAARLRGEIADCEQNCSILACNRRIGLTSQIRPFLGRLARM